MMNVNVPDLSAKDTMPPTILIAFAEKVVEDLLLTPCQVRQYLEDKMHICHNCGAEHPFIDRFCPECGEYLVGATDTPPMPGETRA